MRGWSSINLTVVFDDDPGSVIAVSGNDQTPAPEFLRALHPDTVVVIPDAVKKKER